MADNARFDNNHVPSLLALSSAGDGATVALYADPTSHRLLISPGFATASTTWTSTGNTNTVTDANCTTSSFISIMYTDIPVGLWKVVPGTGSFVITSSDSESAGFAFKYKILS